MSEREEAAAIMKMSCKVELNSVGAGKAGRRFKGLKFNAGAMGQKLRLISESHQWVLSERKIWTTQDMDSALQDTRLRYFTGHRRAYHKSGCFYVLLWYVVKASSDGMPPIRTSVCPQALPSFPRASLARPPQLQSSLLPFGPPVSLVHILFYCIDTAFLCTFLVSISTISMPNAVAIESSCCLTTIPEISLFSFLGRCKVQTGVGWLFLILK